MPKIKKRSQKELSEREQHAIEWELVIGQNKGKTKAYKLAFNGSLEELDKLTTINSNAGKWWRSDKVQKYVKKYTLLLERLKQKHKIEILQEIAKEFNLNFDELQKGILKYNNENNNDDNEKSEASANGANSKISTLIDYSKEENQIAKLNRMINNASNDDRAAIDALKLMIQTQKDNKKDDENEIHRFYTPLKCSECQLYKLGKMGVMRIVSRGAF